MDLSVIQQDFSFFMYAHKQLRNKIGVSSAARDEAVNVKIPVTCEVVPTQQENVEYSGNSKKPCYRPVGLEVDFNVKICKQ